MAGSETGGEMDTELDADYARLFDRLIDDAVTVAMGLQDEEHEAVREEVVRAVAALADAERALGLDEDPEERFSYLAGLVGTDRPRSDGAEDVMEALQPES